MEHSVIEFGWNAAFFGSVFSIILIDIILSGDNSIVIALAVQTLPPEKRKWGMIYGASAAALMRVGFTTIASFLLKTPYLKLIGGALILWIAIKLLSENEDPDTKHKQGHTLWHAIWIIMVADVTMSIDNVLSVAGASKGSPVLLWFGLGLSIPLVIFGSSILSGLMAKYPIIVILGAAVLGKVGGEMIAGDPVLRPHLAFIPHVEHAFAAVGVLFILAWAAWFMRRMNKAKENEPPKG